MTAVITMRSEPRILTTRQWGSGEGSLKKRATSMNRTNVVVGYTQSRKMNVELVDTM